MKRLFQTAQGLRNGILKLSLILLVLPMATASAESEDAMPGGQDVFEWMQDEYEEDYVVSASKRRQKLSETPVHVSIITSEQIERYGSISMSEVFRLIPNLHVQYRNTSLSKHSARGINAKKNRILTLIDGVDVSNIGGIEALSFFSTKDIERIEFVHGPGSTLYGANAYSGILQIFTKQAAGAGMESWAEAGGGEWNRFYTRAGIRGQEGVWKYSANVAAESLPSQSPYSGEAYEQLHAGGRLSYELDSDTNLRLDFIGKSVRGQDFINGGDSSEATSAIGALTFNHGDWMLRSFVNITGYKTLITIPAYLYIDSSALRGSGNFTATDTQVGRPIGKAFEFPAITVAAYLWDNELLHQGELGVDTLLTSGLNTRLQFYEARVSDNPSEMVPFKGGNQDWRIGAFLNLEHRPTDNVILNAGLRGDVNSIKQNMFSPRLSGILRLTDNQSIRLSFLQAFRKPSAMEFGAPVKLIATTGPGADFMEALVQGNYFGEDFANLGEVIKDVDDTASNIYLKSEKVYSVEVAYQLEFFGSKLRVDTNLYYDLHRDSIVNQWDYSWLDDQGRYQCAESPEIYVRGEFCQLSKPFNSDTPMDVWGIVLSTSYSPSSDWLLQANATFRETYLASKRWPWGGKESSIVRAEKEAGEEDPNNSEYRWLKRLTDTPNWLLNASATHHPEEGIQLGAHWYYASAIKRDFLQGIHRSPSANDPIPMRIEPISMLHLHLGYKMYVGNEAWLELAVAVENALDTNQRESPGGVTVGLNAHDDGRSPYQFDPPRKPMDTAHFAERHRRVIMGLVRGEF